MNVQLTALVKSKPGKAGELKIELLTLVNESSKEDACIKYELHQSVSDESQFIFHEIWADEAGFDLHNQTPHIKNFIRIADGLVDDKIVIYKTQIVK